MFAEGPQIRHSLGKVTLKMTLSDRVTYNI